MVQIDVEVGQGLGSIHQHPGAGLAGQGAELRDGEAAAQGVGHLGQGHQFWSPGQQRPVVILVDLTAGGWQHIDHRIGGRGHQLPGNDVGVVVAFHQQDTIPRLEPGTQVALCHQIDPFGGPPGPDDLPVAGGPDPLGQLLAHLFEAAGGLIRQAMCSPVHIGIATLVVVAEGINDRARLLCGGRIVQIHQGVSVHPGGQQGEIPAQTGPYQWPPLAPSARCSRLFQRA